MYKIAKDLNMHIIQVSIPEVSTENMSGLPSFIPAPHMAEYSITSSENVQATDWTAPQIIETANRLAKDPAKSGCILFIDDLHRVNMAVAPYLYGLLGERRLGSFKLDGKVAIMGAMNDSDEAGFSGVDSPIKDRIGILQVPFDYDYWYPNHGRHLHFYISSFLKTHSTYVQEDESTMIEQFATPRSWTHLANEFELYDREFIQEHCRILASQKVSKAAAAELAKHIAYIEAIDFTEKVKSKEMIDINDLKPIDQILYAYIINYIDTVDDAAYAIDLINKNESCSNFFGFVAGELATKFMAKDNGKRIPDGVIALLEKFLNKPIDKKAYSKFTEKDQKIYDKMEFVNRSELMKVASEFIH